VFTVGSVAPREVVVSVPPVDHAETLGTEAEPQIPHTSPVIQEPEGGEARIENAI